MAGIYIHIPFCRQACNYCNFHFSTSDRYQKAVVNAMVKEIRLLPSDPDFSSITTLQTVYLGGGTPSILSIESIQRLLDTVKQEYSVETDAEITLEANPDDISSDNLRSWLAAGVNRLSVGLQSFNDAELSWMNRAHNAQQALQSLNLIQQAGFRNYSVDLIYGSPLLTDEMWVNHLNQVVQAGVPHLSCYALTIEPQTPLHKLVRTGKKQMTVPEQQAGQFQIMTTLLKEAGFLHYEISNFALPGFESRHNSSYWKQAHYLGVGPSAHSYNGAIRRWNVANNLRYVQSLESGQIPFEREQLTETQKYNEYIMTALRTSGGILQEQLRFLQGSETWFNDFIHQAKNWETSGHLMRDESGWRLTELGKLFADGIAADLFAG